MSDPSILLSSQEFAEKIGVSTSTVSKWLRSGKLKGSKQGGKWMISADQLTEAAPAASSQSPVKQPQTTDACKAEPTTAPATGKADKKSYTVEEFSTMTYLTPFGVERYLKDGRLSGTRSASGQWQIDGANLDKGNIQRLVRK